MIAILINYEFIPTNYLTILAILKNEGQYLNCPESTIGLFNGYYISLFLSPGTIIIMTNPIKMPILDETNPSHPDLAGLMTKAHIGNGNIQESNLPGTSAISMNNSVDLNADQEWSASEASIYSIPEVKPHDTPSFPKTSRDGPSTSYQKKPTDSALYVSNVQKGATRKGLFRHFQDCGNIKDILKEDQNSPVAIVIFHEDEGAQRAIKDLHGRNFMGKQLGVQLARKRESSVLLHNKHANVSLRSMRPMHKEHLQKFKVVSVNSKSKENSQSKNLATNSTDRQPIRMTLQRLKEQEDPHQNPPHSNNQIMSNDLHGFNVESFKISPTEDIKVPPYETISFRAKLIKEEEPHRIISNCKVSLVSGPAPYVQVTDGIYPVTNSLLTPSIRNNSSAPMDVSKDKIIQGTSCHMKDYVMDQVSSMEGGWSSFHLQAKTFQRFNQINDFSNRLNNTEDPGLQIQDVNPWMMETDD